ncbi:hypothetical protein PHYSODRAFT_479925 [Phytophthora sojae]|uniref:Uncharacterized protein n=1 Tax=Phytophthora sojae (strain P6497) TaxID=1094619 RepID=G4YUS7_PHYSP|nr:hypothetical protein PHYSODRAFT_479925 [Phytophthora sojae]EGZ26002.1 hypothetical protein PHYSODRAFT_479925 [Phytophthora sojae]|eukprot:XP_009521290.1 hypothetical protein PHYSODRAFT_479925 [Phytophthora sojae]
MLEKFECGDVGHGLPRALDGTSDTEVASALDIARQLTRRDLQQTLLTLAVEKAVKLDDETLSSLRSLESLWAVVFSRSNEMTFQTLPNKFQQMSPRFLARAIKTFSNFPGDGRFPDDKKAVLVAILACRSEWLASQIRVLERPFSWKMPAAEFPDFPQVETFLRSSEATIITEGMFSSEDEPRVTKKLCSMWGPIYQMNASFKLEDMGRGWSGAVTIIKTREWYDQRQTELRYMQKELKDLRAAIAETLVSILHRRRLAS